MQDFPESSFPGGKVGSGQGNRAVSGNPVRGLNEYRTLIYWTPIADPSDPLSRRSSVSHSGRKVLILDDLFFGNSAAENWSCHLIKK